MEQEKTNPVTPTSGKNGKEVQSLMGNNYDSLMNTLAMYMVGVFDLEQVQKESSEDLTIIVAPLRKPMMMEDVMETIERFMTVQILFAYREGTKEIEAVAYTKPTPGNMTVIHLQSHMYGAIEQVIFDVFDSVEIMYSALEKSLSEHMKKTDGMMIQCQNALTLFNAFH